MINDSIEEEPKIINIMSDVLEQKLSIKLNIEDKNLSNEVDKMIETEESEKVDTSNIIKLKINKFKIPFEVNVNNIDKFLKSNDTNTSLSHLYL